MQTEKTENKEQPKPKLNPLKGMTGFNLQGVSFMKLLLIIIAVLCVLLTIVITAPFTVLGYMFYQYVTFLLDKNKVKKQTNREHLIYLLEFDLKKGSKQFKELTKK